MRRTLALGVVLAMAAIATAQPVDTLPEFSGRWYLTVVYDSPISPEGVALNNFLHNDPGMRQLASQTNFNEWTNDKAIVQRTDWRKYLGEARPAILLQARAERDGVADVVFFSQGSGVQSGPVLLGNINRAIKAYVKNHEKANQLFRQRQQQDCGPRGCPLPVRPQPQVQPPVQPQVTPPTIQPLIPSVVVDVDAEEAATEDETGDDGFPLLLLLIPALAGAAGIYSGIKN